MAKVETQPMTVEELAVFIEEASDCDRDNETKVLYKYRDDEDSEAVSFASIKFVKTETKDGIKREMIFVLQ